MNINPRKIKGKIHFKSKYLFIILAIICCCFIVISSVNPNIGKPFRVVSSYIIVPIQKGMNNIGLWFTDKTESLKQLKEVMAENDELKSKVDELTLENTKLYQQQSELDRLRKLYELDTTYADYNKVAARIIAKDPGNWYSIFIIDKGSNDGIAKDMNVIGDGGLVGIVIDVGPNNAKIRSIIDDESSVSAKFSSTSDLCFVQGNLKLMNDGLIQIINIKKDAQIKNGDMVVTSHVSPKFLQDILIGYVSELKEDSNNLTKSGTIIPVVDFGHLEEVFVITELKTTSGE